jgi:hypothetical protein
MSVADQHLLRGLIALHALDARLFNRQFYKLKNGFLEAVGQQAQATVCEHVDADEMGWIVVSAEGFTFRMPSRFASNELRERATYTLKAPVVTEGSKGAVDVQAELRRLDAAVRALSGSTESPITSAAAAPALA